MVNKERFFFFRLRDFFSCFLSQVWNGTRDLQSQLQFTHTADPVQFWQHLTVGLSTFNSISALHVCICEQYLWGIFINNVQTCLDKMKDPSRSMYDDNYKQGELNYSFNRKKFLWLALTAYNFETQKLARMGKLWHVWLKKLNKQCHFIYSRKHWRLYVIFIISFSISSSLCITNAGFCQMLDVRK